MDRNMNVPRVSPQSLCDMPSLPRLKLIRTHTPAKRNASDPGMADRDLREVNQALQRQLKALTILAHEMRNGRVVHRCGS